MQKIFSLFKNKFFLTFTLFLIYTFVLSDSDILYLFKKKNEIRKTNKKIELTSQKFDALKLKFKNLKTKEGVEKFARENKYFKREDEDIFVITHKKQNTDN
jgi:cell division protein FtsL